MRNRDPQFLFAAALLHAALIVAAWRTTYPSLASSAEGDEILLGAPGDEIAFDLVPDAPQNQPQEAPQPIARIEPSPAPKVGRSAPRGRASEVPPEDSPYPDPEATAGAPPSAQDTPVQKQPLPEALPGLDGKPIWTMPGVLPSPNLAGRMPAPPAPVVPGAPPPPRPLGEPIHAALDYLGSGTPPSPFKVPEPVQNFPAAGTLASAVTDELRSSSTAPESETSFELVIDAQGRLASVNVIAVDPDDRKAAEGVARAIAKRFAGQTFPLPSSFAGGSRIQVAVRSQITMPDGTSRGIPTPRPSLPGVKSPYDIKEDSLDDRHRPGSIASQLPPPKLGISLKFDFDLANIGAKRRRVMHTRVHAVPLAGSTSPASPAAKQ
ncbi:hypothetical protein [Polyangium aurulentum]|uniref:hypothetical protein n=1 Tax=Polyangium aurulentum TaxID=2567896 RepID=UPI0010AE56F8|nr:hypothetical protein [Polyangium aurulentum]UQA62745.1 hypothetical protein E8A73_020765 [Polyangium aurulentum]